MAIHFQRNLQQALGNIGFTGEHQQFVVHVLEIHRDESAEDVVTKYGKTKWELVDTLNAKYASELKEKFDLYNWLDFNDKDEVSYFLSECGSNTLNYSQFKAPHAFHIWFGSKGFVLGVEQKGTGFNAQEVHDKNLKENEGAAFNFFRKCQSSVFFDNAQDARMVLMEFRF